MALGFGVEATEVKDRAIQVISNIDTFLEVSDRMIQHASKKDAKEDWGQNPTRLYPIVYLECSVVPPPEST